MARGIMGWIALAGTLALAVPIAFMGVDFVVNGDPLGWAFLAIAAAAVLVEEYAMRPTDVPESVAGRVAGAVTKEPEDE